MTCLETTDLVHQYSDREKILDHVSLQVKQGSIYGFLGPNGAGKTTTLRLILGLLKKQHGDIRLFGQPFDGNRVSILRKVGSLIETPSLYAQLTAYENLEVLRAIHRCPRKNIDVALSTVGLSHTGNKRAGQFSLGMKQRLSIAMAMLHQPSLLILDEPTNGLDPTGIMEIRGLLQRLNSETGVTIVVSSHLLAEIEKLVSHVGIIHQGRMLFQGTLDELMRHQHQVQSIAWRFSDNERATALMLREGLSPRAENGRLLVPTISHDMIARLNRTMVQAGVDVYEIHHNSDDLESVFMNLINQ